MAIQKSHLLFFVLCLLVLGVTSTMDDDVHQTVGKVTQTKDEAMEKTQDMKQTIEEKGSQMKDEASEKSKEAKQKMEEAGQEAKEGSESWTNWAKEKIQEGLGLKQNNLNDAAKSTKEKAEEMSEEAMEKARQAKDRTTQTSSETVGEAAKKSKEKAEEMSEEAMKKTKQASQTSSEKAAEMSEAAKKKAEEAKEGTVGMGKTAVEEAKKKVAEAEEQLVKAKEMGKERVGEAGEQLVKAKEMALEKAKQGYEAAKSKAGESVESAKVTISSNYEAAKQKTQEVKDKLTGQGQNRGLQNCGSQHGPIRCLVCFDNFVLSAELCRNAVEHGVTDVAASLFNDNDRVQNKYYMDHDDGAKRLKIDNIGIQHKYLRFDRLPVGYKFIPTDIELINFLENQVMFGLIQNSIQEIEATQFYSKAPNKLEWNSPVDTKEMYFFIHHTDDSYRPFPSTRIVGDGIGCWKPSGDPAEYICRSPRHYEIIVNCGDDYKVSYIYFRGKPPVGNELPKLKKTAWVMDEYHLSQEYYTQSSPKMEGKWVLGRIQCGKNAYDNLENFL